MYMLDWESLNFDISFLIENIRRLDTGYVSLNQWDIQMSCRGMSQCEQTNAVTLGNFRNRTFLGEFRERRKRNTNELRVTRNNHLLPWICHGSFKQNLNFY
jgi:hypothetical protein